MKPGRGRAGLHVQAIPVGPWVWTDTGTAGHTIGGHGVWVRGRGYHHGVRIPVRHPGSRGKGAWKKAAARVAAAAVPTFRAELADLVKGF